MDNSYELSRVIQTLREDLTAAAREGDGQTIRFNVQNIDIELQAVVEKEAGGEAGAKAKFWVLDANAKLKGEYKKAITHKIKLSLQPVDTSKSGERDTNESNTLQLTDKS